MEYEEILQYDTEFLPLLELYVKSRPKKVLEIGVKHGGTLWHWIEWAQPGTTVVAVDECRQADVSGKALEWGRSRGIDVIFIKGDSHDPGVTQQIHAHGPYDFVFIDGDHSYEGVKEDWTNYGDSGIVAFHDINYHTVKLDQNGAHDLWQEIKNLRPSQEFIAGGYDGNGIGVLKKVSDQS